MAHDLNCLIQLGLSCGRKVLYDFAVIRWGRTAKEESHFCECGYPVRIIFKASIKTYGRGLRQESRNGEPHLCPVLILVGAARREGRNIEFEALTVSCEFVELVELVVIELKREVWFRFVMLRMAFPSHGALSSNQSRGICEVVVSDVEIAADCTSTVTVTVPAASNLSNKLSNYRIRCTRHLFRNAYCEPILTFYCARVLYVDSCGDNKENAIRLRHTSTLCFNSCVCIYPPCTDHTMLPRSESCIHVLIGRKKNLRALGKRWHFRLRPSS